MHNSVGFDFLMAGLKFLTASSRQVSMEQPRRKPGTGAVTGPCYSPPPRYTGQQAGGGPRRTGGGGTTVPDKEEIKKRVTWGANICQSG